jgi:hypothetical protein
MLAVEAGYAVDARGDRLHGLCSLPRSLGSRPPAGLMHIKF